MEEIFKHVLSQIRNAELNEEPFRHIVIEEIFPADFYPSLLQALPTPSQFATAAYPGTGFGKGKKRWSGLAYPRLHELPLFGELKEFLGSERFSRALLDKFTCPNGIPVAKYKHFSNGAKDFTSVFDLQIDRKGYEILPHADVPSKIVTFQFYLTADDSLKEFGTLFCRTKDGLAPKRSPRAVKSGVRLDRLARLVRNRPRALWHWVARTEFGTEIGFGDSRNWYPWRLFDVVASAPALPNHFMAFAPNENSYHAVRMDIPESSIGRTVIRGFIRAGESSKNFIQVKQ